MKQALFALPLLALLAVPAHADCYADYKAKTDNPLRLHYGVARISDAACGNRTRAANQLKPRLEAGGWTLLNIVSTFGPEGLNERRTDAGQYYLRF